MQGLTQMIQIMHWVVKCKRKKILLHAESISVSVGDRADFRIVRYRCSFRSLADWAEATAAPALHLSKEITETFAYSGSVGF